MLLNLRTCVETHGGGELIAHCHCCCIYLKASPLPPAPLAVAGFMVAGLVAWQYSDRLAGLMGFAVCFFVLLVPSVGVFAGSLVYGC